jgi:hypothetical protein
MSARRLFVIGTLIALSTVAASDRVMAEVPPHQPGTVCYTPQFWCWAQPPGPSGTPCVCPTPYGWVSGTRG